MKKQRLVLYIFVGFLLGIVAGLILGPKAEWLKPFGTFFIRLLSMLVVPLIFSTLAVGVAGVGGIKLGRMMAKTFFYYYATAICSVIIGLLLANAFRLGVGLSLGELANVEPKLPPPFSQIVLELVPTNVVDAAARGSALQIIFFAIVFGVAMGTAGQAADPIKKAIEGLAEAMYRVVDIVLYYAPVGVFALMAWTVGNFGAKVLAPFALLIFVVYLGCILQVGIVYSAFLRFLGGIRPLHYLYRIREAALVAFTTCSSSGTLPVTMRVVQGAGISKATAGFVLPMGATVNMDGTGLYQAVCAVFLANAFGIHLGFSQYILLAVTAILASIGTAGVPGSGLIMLTMVLSAVGVPLEGLALIAGIDRILDMARTCVNVVDDTVAAALVGATEKEEVDPDLLVRPAPAAPAARA
ncbi:MAG: dicarboxylate/amino acid:cation symporter [Bacillota bacterium]|nr:dicarboxylate/amino acid:cation symporter [Bacillota bacterium]